MCVVISCITTAGILSVLHLDRPRLSSSFTANRELHAVCATPRSLSRSIFFHLKKHFSASPCPSFFCTVQKTSCFNLSYCFTVRRAAPALFTRFEMKQSQKCFTSSEIRNFVSMTCNRLCFLIAAGNIFPNKLPAPAHGF